MPNNKHQNTPERTADESNNPIIVGRMDHNGDPSIQSLQFNASVNARTFQWQSTTEGGCGAWTNGVLTGSNGEDISSVSYTFVSADVGGVVEITAGTGFTPGSYRILSVAGGAATLDRSGGSPGSTGGSFSVNRLRSVAVKGGVGVADTIRVCAKSSLNAYAWIPMATIP